MAIFLLSVSVTADQKFLVHHSGHHSAEEWNKNVSETGRDKDVTVKGFQSAIQSETEMKNW